jgi:hypothetical protein
VWLHKITTCYHGPLPSLRRADDSCVHPTARRSAAYEMRELSPPQGVLFQPTKAHHGLFGAFEAAAANSLLQRYIELAFSLLNKAAVCISKPSDPRLPSLFSHLVFSSAPISAASWIALCYCVSDKTHSIYICIKRPGSILSFRPTSDITPGANCTNPSWENTPKLSFYDRASNVIL